MSDPREPGKVRRSRIPSDQPEAGPRRNPTEDSPRRPAKGDAIRAVSELLIRKKSAFDGPPTPASLPKFPRPPDAILSDLKKSPSLRAKFAGPGTSLEPPPVALPDGDPPGRPGGDEQPADLPAASNPATSSRGVDRVPAGGVDGVRQSPVDWQSTGDGPEAAASTASRVGLEIPIAPPSSILGEAITSPGPPGDSRGPAYSTAGPAVDPAANPVPLEAGGAERVVGLSGVAEMVRGAAVDLPQDLHPASGLDDGSPAGAAWPGVLVGSGPNSGANPLSTARGNAASIAVRNPFASGLRNLSLAPPDFPDAGGASPGLDATEFGSVPVDPAFGGAASTQGGAASDLSKTNDLLRQLIDAVKRQRDVSLPVGGPSAYPDR